MGYIFDIGVKNCVECHPFRLSGYIEQPPHNISACLQVNVSTYVSATSAYFSAYPISSAWTRDDGIAEHQARFSLSDTVFGDTNIWHPILLHHLQPAHEIHIQAPLRRHFTVWHLPDTISFVLMRRRRHIHKLPKITGFLQNP